MITGSADTTTVFRELVYDTLYILLPTVAFLAWAWTGYVVVLDVAHTVTAYTAFIFVAGSTAFFSWQHRRNFPFAIGIYLVGMLLALTTIALAYRQEAVFYLYIPLILLTAAVANLYFVGGITILATLCVMVVGNFRGAEWSTLALPIAMILFTALTSWLSSQRLFTALDWIFETYRKSERNAADARNHRAELQRVLHSLDIAYARLEQTNQRLIFAQEAAEKAYRFKSDFVANVSHELRTPLNLIIGFTEMMATAPESYAGVPLPREYRGDVMATYRSARHLRELIDDVLDLSQLETGHMPINKTRVDLNEVVDEAIGMVRGLAEARGLRLDAQVPPRAVMLDLDATRIRQVLLNLLTNAIRYTDSGWVRVDVVLEATRVLLSVTDSGRGIAAKQLDKAFEAFSRLDEETLHEGTGLGLAVSKKFVELHGGEMGIESVVGQGTRVYWTLPLPERPADEELSLAKLNRPLFHAGGRPVVLVLHSDERVLALLQRHVSGYSFVLATTPEEATRRVNEALPHIILMDLSWQRRWPTIMAKLSASTSLPVLTCPLPNVHHLALLMGATDFLPKPVMRADIAAALGRLSTPPRTALVVDDNPHFVRLIVRMLKAIDPNLRIYEAFSGEEGLKVARTQRPDVIFLDLVMPEVTGFTVIEAVSQDPDLAGTAIIVVSVRSTEQELAPLEGEFHLHRGAGFSLTEILHLLQSTMATFMQPDAAFPTSAATALAVSVDSPVS